jgi:hypothetical protein
MTRNNKGFSSFLKIFFLSISLALFFQNAISQDFDREVQIINLLKKHKFRTLHRKFDKNLASSVSTQKMKMIWAGLEKTVGKYESYGKTEIKQLGENSKTVTPIYFKNGTLMLETSFDEKGKLTGIFLRAKSYILPSYGENLLYNREEISIQTGSFSLPGEILYPKNLDQKVPLVILVHGSGANNRYEDGGNIKVFKDLALGLVSKGVACLIYDKRTLVYKSVYDTAQFTINDETVADAVSAYYLARTKLPVDTNHIFIVGHSLGGYALPLILERCVGVAGGISMAGAARPLEDLITDQYWFFTHVDGKYSLTEKYFLNKEKKKIRKVKDPELRNSKPKPRVLAYWPTAFWVDIQNYKPVEKMAALPYPVLFLQGDRDFQVTDKDFSLWKSKYLEKQNWSFIAYPKLNHLFVEGEGKPNPAEYWNSGNIPLYVIEDIYNWIKSK